MSEKKNFLYSFFTSKRLAIVLIIIVGLLALIGTLVPQIDIFTAEQLAEFDAAHPFYHGIDSVLKVLQFSDRIPFQSSLYTVYHSWWFLLAVLLLILNTFVCSIDKLIALQKMRGKLTEKNIPAKLTGHDNLVSEPVKIKYDDLKEKTSGWVAKHFRKAEKVESKNSVYYRLDKFSFSRYGYILVHIGLLIVFAGAIVSSFTREKGFVWLSDNSSTDVYYSRTDDIEKPLGYTLKAEDLAVEMYPDGHAVRDWYSTLIIEKDGIELANKRIEVNNPLNYDGRSFFQSSWNSGFSLKIKVTEKATGYEEIFNIPINQDLMNPEGDKTYKMKEREFYFRVDAFLPHFIIDKGRFASISMELRNPAAVVRAYWPGLEEPTRLVLFSMHGTVDMKSMREGKQVDNPYEIVLLQDIGRSHVTGIEIREDAGTDIVYIGFFFIMAGVLIGFYFYHQIFYILLTGTAKSAKIEIAGVARRNKYQFKKKFESISADLLNSISQR